MRPGSSLKRWRWQWAAELRGSRKGGSDVAAQFFYCIQCHKKYPTHQKLFDTLHNFSRTAPDECPSCGGARDLHVSLDFQLGAGDSDYKVISALLPGRLESWMGEAGGSNLLSFPGRPGNRKQTVLLDAVLARHGQRSPLRSARRLPGTKAVRKPDGAGAGEASGTGVSSPILLTLGNRRPPLGRAELVPSAKADSDCFTCAFPALPCRAFTSRRCAAGG
jgi:hypothetical protein